MTDITAIEELTPREYRLLSQGHALRELDREAELHRAAWLGVVVNTTEGSRDNPRRKYTRFNQFFNQERVESDIRNTFKTGKGSASARDGRLARLAEYERMNNEKGGKDG